MAQYEIIGDDYDDDDYGEIGGMGTAEIIGGEEEDLLDALSVGADYDVIGARQKVKRPNKGKVARRILANRAVLLKQGKPDHRRRFPLGFVPTSIAAASTVNVPAEPQNLFRSERLVIPSDIAFDFGVVDYKVGNESQLVSGGEVPAALFTEVSIDTDIHFKTAEVGNQIQIQVRNKTAGAIEFVAGVIGTVLR